MSIYDDTVRLEALIQRSVRIAQRLSACLPHRPTATPPTNQAPASAPPPEPEPMQVDRYNLSAQECSRRRAHNLCLYCGGSGHLIATCPVRPSRPAVSTIHAPASVSHLVSTDVVIALVDSGAAGNFISLALLTSLGLPRMQNERTMLIQNILGKPLGRGQISYLSPVVTLHVGPLHSEDISFWVLEGSTSEVILG